MHTTRLPLLRHVPAMLALAAAFVQAQPIYRCGNSYSQMPCAQGVAINADDSRTSEQKAQTDAATVQAAQMAQRMERDRLAQAQRPSAARPGTGLDKPRQESARKRATDGPAGTRAAPRKTPRDPDYFTAAARQDDGKKPAAKAPRN